ncbi:N-acetyltransferase [Bacteroidia bacterium]|nr:N-acetyltransferase [Bacteroidia bacterium]
MDFLKDSCFISLLNSETLAQCQPFTCGDADLDDFFRNDTDNYSRQLLGKSYCYRLKNDASVMVCAFTLAYSSVDVRHLPNSRRKKITELIPHEKNLSSYPAILVCRVGVSKDFRGKGGCRYVMVDAYNNEATRRYYTANGFKDAFSTEEQEKEYLGMLPEKELKTRLMYFDLMLLSK